MGYGGPNERSMDRLDAAYGDRFVREINAYAAADAVLAVSTKEADLINDLVADPTLAFAVPLMDDLEPSSTPLADRRGAVFIGNFRHPPNAAAVEFMCREILPLIDPILLREHPLSIVGNGLEQLRERFDPPSPFVRLIGWVPSVVPYLANARLSVVPLRSGAGTKTKLIQSLMVGTPTVSTSIGAEGLALADGEDFLLANKPQDFALSVTRLLTDDYLWQRLAANGRAPIGVVHSRNAVTNSFSTVIDTVFSRPVKAFERQTT